MSAQLFRSAFQRLLRAGNRGYAFGAVATLSLGIGAVIAVAGLLHAVLLAPLGMRDEDRVVRIAERNDAQGVDDFAVATGNFLAWQRSATSLQAAAAFTARGVNLLDADGAERVTALLASSDIWAVLGREPLQGRALKSSADDLAGAALISAGYWQRHYNGAADVLGRTLRIEGAERVIVGIVPADLRLGSAADIWLPLDTQADAANHGDRRLTVLARLADGSSLDSARAELTSIAQRLATEQSESNAGWSVRLDSARDWLVSDEQRQGLGWLLTAVSLLLLITCANLASLQIARALHQRREHGIRLAIGADTRSLRNEVLAETLLLVAIGAAFGLLLAAGLLDLARSLLAATLPSVDALALRPGVAAVAILSCALTAVSFALVPATLAAHADPASALAGSTRSNLGSRQAPLRSALVISQFAIATVLLAGAALLAQHVHQLSRNPLGFAAEQVLTARIALPNIASDADLARQQQVFDRLLAELGSLPGVHAVAIASDAPLGAVDTQMLVAPGPMPVEASANAQHAQASWRIVSSDYFGTLGIPLLSGRTFRASDEPIDSIILSQVVASRVFGAGVDPLGRLVTMGNQQRRVVVGVAADTRQRSLADDMTPTVYLPTSWYLWESMTLTVRTDGDPAALASAVRQRAAAIVPERPLYDVRTLSQVVSDSIAAPRLQAGVILAFAAAALLMAAVGIGSVSAWLVARRAADFALRQALGATPARMRREVLVDGSGRALLGIALGACALLALLGFARTQLELSPVSMAAAIAAAGFSLLAASVIACWLPARRAARIAPAQALAAS